MMITSHVLLGNLMQVCPSQLKSTLLQIYVEYKLVKLTRPADVKIFMFKQATDLQVPTFAKFSGDPHTCSYALW